MRRLSPPRGPLLGAGQLTGTDAAGQVALDELIDTSRAASSARVADVLVEQAMAEENHPAATGVR